MGWLSTLLRRCAHASTFRERRELHGVMVLHLVCQDCGRAVPAIDRTPEEHQAIVAAGQVRPPTIQRVAFGVILPMRGRRRRRP